MILYHGSEKVIKQPEWGKGKFYNDYGRGFYCTENKDLAKEWACTDTYIGYVNMYQIDLNKLNVLYLKGNDYSVLHWLAILIEHRGTRITTPIAKRSATWLKDNYYININDYDVIVGCRADDSYFAFARAFLNNEISYKQLCYAMNLGQLGEQFVVKSKYGFDNIKYVESEKADVFYLKQRRNRDNEARKLYLEEMEKEDLEGLYIRDMMKLSGE